MESNWYVIGIPSSDIILQYMVPVNTLGLQQIPRECQLIKPLGSQMFDGTLDQYSTNSRIVLEMRQPFLPRDAWHRWLVVPCHITYNHFRFLEDPILFYRLNPPSLFGVLDTATQYNIYWNYNDALLAAIHLFLHNVRESRDVGLTEEEQTAMRQHEPYPEYLRMKGRDVNGNPTPLPTHDYSDIVTPPVDFNTMRRLIVSDEQLRAMGVPRPDDWGGPAT